MNAKGMRLMNEMTTLVKKNLGISLNVVEAQNRSTVSSIPHKSGQMVIVDSGEIYYDLSTGKRICINSGILDDESTIHNLGALCYGFTDIHSVDAELEKYTEPGIYKYSYSLNTELTSVTEVMIVTLLSSDVSSGQTKIKQLISRGDSLHKRVLTISGSEIVSEPFEEMSGTVPIMRI